MLWHYSLAVETGEIWKIDIIHWRWKLGKFGRLARMESGETVVHKAHSKAQHFGVLRMTSPYKAPSKENVMHLIVK